MTGTLLRNKREGNDGSADNAKTDSLHEIDG